MSLSRPILAGGSFFLAILLRVSPATAADAPTSAPAPAIAAPRTSQPADAANLGVVRAALTQLYVMPRAPAPLPGNGASRQGPATRPAGTAAGPSQPAISICRDSPPASAPASVAPGTPMADDARPVGLYIEATPWSNAGPHLSERDREWADYRYYGGNPSRYGLGRYARDDGYFDGGNYRFGFMEGYDYGRFEGGTDQRVQSLMSHASVQIDRGVRYFRQGQYQQAADTFQLASETDQGDAVSRIYAGHALFALGRYRDAVRHIRRAFELQPRIAYLTYDLRGDYENPAVFDAQLRALGRALDLAPRDPDRLFLMGYLHYYTGQRPAAYRFFSRAVEADRNDAISDRLMRNAQPPDVDVDAQHRPPQPGR